MDKVKVLVVDDSAFMRKMISDILESHIKIEVVGTARNGQDALDKIDTLHPDVVTLDIEMPVMDGLTALSHIMKNKQRPVIMLSSLTKEGADKTLESMELGAVDFVTKPSGSISLNIKEKEAEIISKVLQATHVKVTSIKPKSYQTSVIQSFNRDKKQRSKLSNTDKFIIAIGTSTGGPRALQQVVTRLPADIPAPIVIVQHMPAGFTKSLANRLNNLSHISVREVTDGEWLENGTAYIAPGGYQFRVVESSMGLKAKVTKEENRNGHQPSVDVLFESLAELTKHQLLSVIMTGMGADGANGIIEMKAKKSNTIVVSEDKETCVVYGMPQAAEKTKLVDFVVELPSIADTIVNQLKVRGE
ncbi:protein-glutamate methylesterase/protein-glutamine glutaminase [Amphibacillus cookii]|uniref:protein-glutamate methylesterase/protein-glutamine glutaminase n=1 Tax=Amphibacillus cookii TaxID=767787 RepID=UPI001957F102|nr:chemotaxis response regulator protein-glutamate methylesterase [Amphibacillus cookii]MBM7540591.1 two-component system chemotaxis response regulator CheB [Amphibacillus cookii]